MQALMMAYIKITKNINTVANISIYCSETQTLSHTLH